MSDQTIQLSPRPFREVVTEECFAWLVPPGEVIGERARVPKRALKPRRAVCYRMWAEHSWSFKRIGQKLGAHHTTVMHHVREHVRALPPTRYHNWRVREYAVRHGLVSLDQAIAGTHDDRAA